MTHLELRKVGQGGCHHLEDNWRAKHKFQKLTNVVTTRAMFGRRSIENIAQAREY
jgi:hypothetical protein